MGHRGVAAHGRPCALWYATVTEDFHAQWSLVNNEVGLWFDGATPPSTPWAHLAAEVRCTGRLLELKHRALRAHASQTQPLEALLGAETFRHWWATESFAAADPSSR